MVTIIDYGLGNINAFVNVYKRLDVPVKVARSREDLAEVEKMILPGVGHFDHAMQCLEESGMRELLDELVLERQVPVMGICVGMQMMAEWSEEGFEPGLGWISGSVKRFDESKIPYKTRLPHMGWNDVMPMGSCPLFAGLEKDAVFYFLHSYYFECAEGSAVASVSYYGSQFASAVHHLNRYGVQFHPEKSHHYGEVLLHNFAKL